MCLQSQLHAAFQSNLKHMTTLGCINYQVCHMIVFSISMKPKNRFVGLDCLWMLVCEQKSDRNLDIPR